MSVEIPTIVLTVKNVRMIMISRHRRMLRIAPLLCMFICASCVRAQNPQPADVQARVADSLAQVQQRTAIRAELTAELKRMGEELGRVADKDVSLHLIKAEHAGFRALSITARALDNTGAYGKEILDERALLLRDDSLKPGAAARITNGMIRLYGMYGVVYRMRFGDDPERIGVLDEMNARVQKAITSSKEPIEPVALMSESMFHLVRDIMRSIDRDSLFNASFPAIMEHYEEGKRAAVTDEDRFLNGLYRTFEVSQLWALFIDPDAREDISAMNKRFIADVGGADDVGHQMASAMAHLARINLMIARATVANNF